MFGIRINLSDQVIFLVLACSFCLVSIVPSSHFFGAAFGTGSLFRCLCLETLRRYGLVALRYFSVCVWKSSVAVWSCCLAKFAGGFVWYLCVCGGV